MKFGNGTSIGIATIGEWAVGALLAGIFIWRASAGDTFEETSTWLIGFGAALTAVLSAWRRSWSARNDA